MRARPVVAEGETAPADDGLLVPNASNRRRAGAGDYEFAIRARMGPDAGGGRIVSGPDAQEPGNAPRLAPGRSAFKLASPRPDSDRTAVGLIEPGACQGCIDKRSQGGRRGIEIDMNIGR